MLLLFGEHSGRSCCGGDNADVDRVEGKHNEVDADRVMIIVRIMIF